MKGKKPTLTRQENIRHSLLYLGSYGVQDPSHISFHCWSFELTDSTRAYFTVPETIQWNPYDLGQIIPAPGSRVIEKGHCCPHLSQHVLKIRSESEPRLGSRSSVLNMQDCTKIYFWGVIFCVSGKGLQYHRAELLKQLKPLLLILLASSGKGLVLLNCFPCMINCS